MVHPLCVQLYSAQLCPSNVLLRLRFDELASPLRTLLTACSLQDMFATGSTAVTCFVRNEAGGRMLYTANAGKLSKAARVRSVSSMTRFISGDARAVLGRASGALRLSYDHKGQWPAHLPHIRWLGKSNGFRRHRPSRTTAG